MVSTLMKMKFLGKYSLNSLSASQIKLLLKSMRVNSNPATFGSFHNKIRSFYEYKIYH